MKRKILYISGTRADYGLMRPVLNSIHQHPLLSLEIAVTGMHLMDEFGATIDEITSDGFPFFTINATIDQDNKEAMAYFIGEFIQKGTREIEIHRPEIIMVLGDRGEMLGGAIIGAYLSIPVAHIHGGEITSTVDDIVRHAITKLSHIHFPTTHESAERIIRMGEDPSRVFVTGAPGLDQILPEKCILSDQIKEQYFILPQENFLLVVQHPVTLEYDKASEQMKETLEAVIDLNLPTIIIYPNADAGGRKMIDMIRNYESYPMIQVYKSVPHIKFLSLLQSAAVLIGNSSSGIIEAPSFGTPVVNIGSRQRGRQRGMNVIDVGHNKNEILAAVQKALSDPIFLEQVKKGYNPYGDGTCSKKIVKILSTIIIDNSLIQKRMIY